MTAEAQPDNAEQVLADQIDNVIPTRGYSKVPIVGLGGSAGSIEALQSFFTLMPPKSGLAFVVVVHLSSVHESGLAEVIQRCTRMKVVQVVDTLDVQPDTVYVIPPGKTLQSTEGQLRLGTLPEGRHHVVVDVFFRTLADSHGAHAAAVVLSGLDGDGSIGAKRIKERGGLTVAQDPEQALHSGMPRSAIATGMVDWVLPVQDMPARLLSYFRLERAVELPPEDGPEATPQHAMDEAQLRDVLNFLRTRTGRDFADYKRATVLRRIGRRMQVNGVDNLQAYLTCLRTRPGECMALLQDLLISVTNFFRDGDCFAALEQHIPSLFEGKGPHDAVRVWVVACATGEEAYSLAMLLSEHARTLEAPPMIQVFATDLDQEAVQVAREGVYPATIAADVGEERLRRHFLQEHGGYRVRRELREMVLFAVHDVLRDSPFSRLDLVSCRNLLIYLTREAQARVFETLHFALVPQGKLFVGSSEAVDDSSPLFTVVDKKHRIYAQRPLSRAGLPLPQGGGTLARALLAQQAAHDGPVVPPPALVDPPTGSDLLPHPQAGRRPEPVRPAGWADLHLQLLEQLAPPSVLVNGEHDIVHLSPSAGRFLQMGGGEPSRNLLRALHPELRIDVRAALYKAQQQQEVELPPTRVGLAGGSAVTVVRVIPSRVGGENLFLILFETKQDETETAEAKAARMEADPIARHLDAEIERLKSQLRDTVEQYEASTEELKASNEELRAASEELETSREELQSINEELTTVNQELKSKVDQLSHANSDLQNLMNASQIATVFLDRDLRIMRFTPAAVGLFNLIPTDVGRPLSDMATHLDYPGLAQDAATVLERLVPIEREVGQARDGAWFLARLVPYRTLDDRIAGVVFTCIDITDRKRAEELRLWLSALVSATSDAIISFSLDQTILSWNAGAQALFGYTPEQAIGQRLGMLLSGDEQQAQHIVAEVGAGRGLASVETVHHRRDGSEVHIALTVSPVKEANGHVQAGTAIGRDITAARAAAEALRQSEERLRLIMENALEYAIFTQDLERRVTTWNAGAQRLLGYAEDEIVGSLADMIFTPEDRAAEAPQKEARTAQAEGRASDDRVHVRKDGSRFTASGILMLMRNQAGEAIGFVKILRDRTQQLPQPA